MGRLFAIFKKGRKSVHLLHSYNDSQTGTKHAGSVLSSYFSHMRCKRFAVSGIPMKSIRPNSIFNDLFYKRFFLTFILICGK